MSDEFRDFINNLIGGSNGGNWRTSQTSAGGSLNQPNPGPGGAGTQDPYQRTIDAINAYAQARQSARINPVPGHSMGFIDLSNVDPMGFIDYLEQMSNVDRITPSGKWCPPWMSGELGVPNKAKNWSPHPVPKQSEGIHAGEIIAWRAWYWDPKRKRLRSIFVDYEWAPDKPASGEPWNGYGIHAFKEPDQVHNEYYHCRDDLVYGQVALWGDVVEYQLGYTAEFGKIVSVHKSSRCCPAEDIKEVYLNGRNNP